MIQNQPSHELLQISREEIKKSQMVCFQIWREPGQKWAPPTQRSQSQEGQPFKADDEILHFCFIFRKYLVSAKAFFKLGIRFICKFYFISCPLKIWTRIRIQKNQDQCSPHQDPDPKSWFTASMFSKFESLDFRKTTFYPEEGTNHRVGRVPSFFSSRRNWDSPNPSPVGECAPPPPPLWFRGEGHTRWRERGWESPTSNEGTYTVVLFIYMYFVAQTQRQKSDLSRYMYSTVK